MTEGSNRRIYFRDFEFNCETHELYKRGLKIKIRGHPADILALLVEHPGDAVTRQALKERLWPDGRFVDFEHLLNNGINKLRFALRDHAETPRFVETLPGIGYRFIAPVSAAPPETLERLSYGDGAAPRFADQHRAAELADLRIAVLPFANMGSEIDEYFTSALTAELIVQLRRTQENISVISPISPALQDGAGRSPTEIANELQADYVLIGTVWPIPPQLRIVAQLIRCEDHCCTWGESYTRSDSDIFAVQDEITREIISGLSRSLQYRVRPVARGHISMGAKNA